MSVVDWVVCFFFAIPSDRVFAGDNCLRLSAIFEMFVFDYSCKWHVFFGVIYDGVTLVVFGVE